MINKEDVGQNENNKSLNASLMQTAQFFFNNNEAEQKKGIINKQDYCDIEFNEFIQLSQPLHENVFLNKESEKESKIAQKYAKSKKNITAPNQKDITKINNSSRNTEFPSSLVLNKKNINDDDKKDSLSLLKTNQVSSQLLASQNKLQNMYTNIKKSNNQEEKTMTFKESHSNIMLNDKKRGMSLACQSSINEMTDQIFWNKINQIVCLKSTQQPTQFRNNNSASNIYSIRQSVSNNQQGQILSASSIKPIKTSTDVINVNNNLVEFYEDSLKNQNYLLQNFNPVKSTHRIDTEILKSQSQMQAYSTESSKNIKSHGQLPLLNVRPKQQKFDCQDQFRSGFFGSSSTADSNRKQIQIDAIDNQFWSSQPNLRKYAQSMNQNSVKEINLKKKDEVIQSMNVDFLNQPFHSVNYFQHPFPSMSSHYQITNTLKNYYNNHYENLFIPQSQSQNGILNTEQRFEIPIILGNGISNYSSVQDSQQSYFNQSQLQQDIYTNKSLVHQKQNTKSTFSSPSTAPSSVKESRHMLKLQFSDFLETGNERFKCQLDFMEQKQNDVLQIRQPEILNNGYYNQQKESQMKNSKNKLRMNQKDNTKKNLNKVDEEKTEITLKDSQECKNNTQKKLKPLKNIKVSENKIDRESWQVSEELTKLVSQQRTQSLKENSLNFDQRQSASAKIKQNQNADLQKIRIKSCQQQAQLNLQEFSFCVEKNHKIKVDENNYLESDDKKILSQIGNLNDNILAAPKIMSNTIEKYTSSKKWNQLVSLSQTTKENNKFNLKCKQQQNVVKKIFNFDNYSTPQLSPAISVNNCDLEKKQSKLSTGQIQNNQSNLNLNIQQNVKQNSCQNQNNLKQQQKLNVNLQENIILRDNEKENKL
ncbi:hypothetical protein ABPG72_006505 [Tetrahymena utriculariae]